MIDDFWHIITAFSEDKSFWTVYFSVIIGLGYALMKWEHNGKAWTFALFASFSIYFSSVDISALTESLDSYLLFFFYGLFFVFGAYLAVWRRFSFPAFEAPKFSWSPFQGFQNLLRPKPKEKAQSQQRQQNSDSASAREQAERDREASRRAQEQFRRAREEKEHASNSLSDEDILGLRPGFTQEELESNYKRLRSYYHTGNFPDFGDEDLKKQMDEKFQAVQEAYKNLRKIQKS